MSRIEIIFFFPFSVAVSESNVILLYQAKFVEGIEKRERQQQHDNDEESVSNAFFCWIQVENAMRNEQLCAQFILSIIWHRRQI